MIALAALLFVSRHTGADHFSTEPHIDDKRPIRIDIKPVNDLLHTVRTHRLALLLRLSHQVSAGHSIKESRATLVERRHNVDAPPWTSSNEGADSGYRE